MNKLQDPNRLQIRQAREQDIPHLVILENECFDSYYREHRFSEAEFTAYFHKQRSIFFVAIQNSSLIGYVSGSANTVRSHRLSARIESMAVLPTSRRTGRGARLIGCFIEEARRRGCTQVTLEVAVANENSIHFFSKRGFRKVRYLPGYYGENLDGIRMKRAI